MTMRPAHAIALAFLLMTGAAEARTLMTAEEFEAFSTGQTLDYWVGGTFWGSERHLSGRKTLDADAEGPCREGAWFPKDDMICFVYSGDQGEHCWRFWRDGDSVVAEVAGEDGFSAGVTLADKPLSCPGPDVGV
jgi:hypothetical protein